MPESFPHQLRQILASHTQTTKPEWDARPAAVLLPIYKEQEEWSLVFTRRTDTVEEHRGQVSFPGGLIEDRDPTPRETALREAEEEIGLPRSAVEILGSLDALLTVTQFKIFPFIGLIDWPLEFQPNPVEVARVFSVPLRWLLEPSNLEQRTRRPIPQGPEVPVYYFKPFEGEVIWGATARITLNFLELIKPLLLEH